MLAVDFQQNIKIRDNIFLKLFRVTKLKNFNNFWGIIKINHSKFIIKHFSLFN